VFSKPLSRCRGSKAALAMRAPQPLAGPPMSKTARRWRRRRRTQCFIAERLAGVGGCGAAAAAVCAAPLPPPPLKQLTAEEILRRKRQQAQAAGGLLGAPTVKHSRVIGAAPPLALLGRLPALSAAEPSPTGPPARPPAQADRWGLGPPPLPP
jgi:hypothetical protein